MRIRPTKGSEVAKAITRFISDVMEHNTDTGPLTKKEYKKSYKAASYGIEFIREVVDKLDDSGVTLTAVFGGIVNSMIVSQELRSQDREEPLSVKTYASMFHHMQLVLDTAIANVESAQGINLREVMKRMSQHFEQSKNREVPDIIRALDIDPDDDDNDTTIDKMSKEVLNQMGIDPDSSKGKYLRSKLDESETTKVAKDDKRLMIAAENVKMLQSKDMLPQGDINPLTLLAAMNGEFKPYQLDPLHLSALKRTDAQPELYRLALEGNYMQIEEIPLPKNNPSGAIATLKEMFTRMGVPEAAFDDAAEKAKAMGILPNGDGPQFVLDEKLKQAMEAATVQDGAPVEGDDCPCEACTIRRKIVGIKKSLVQQLREEQSNGFASQPIDSTLQNGVAPITNDDTPISVMGVGEVQPSEDRQEGYSVSSPEDAEQSEAQA
jgi:hypothetical protein